ncbi:MAG: DUF692 domain-containing protein [Alphaproteobacteria bacterium]
MQNLGFGLGLRAKHYDGFLKDRPASVNWLEIISENYIQAHPGYWRLLADLRHDYPFVMHGVSLSIGSMDPFDDDYLRSLKKLADYLEVSWMSDHLCFTGINRINTHDLLPIPYTEEALQHVISRVHKVQEAVGRTFTFENASTYMEFDGSTLSEPEFFTALHDATGCGVLLDINNVHVSSTNHGWDAKAYIDAMPHQAVVQYHLAGHTDKGSHLIDTHDAPVVDAVWELFRYALQTVGPRSTMIEWDADIPEFSVLETELLKAKDIASSIQAVA